MSDYATYPAEIAALRARLVEVERERDEAQTLAKMNGDLSEQWHDKWEQAEGAALRKELANHLLYVHPLPWRVGRRVARNVYDANSEGVAMFMHAYTAAIVVDAVNRLQPSALALSGLPPLTPASGITPAALVPKEAATPKAIAGEHKEEGSDG